MQSLSSQGMQLVNQIAARHGFSSDAVATMLQAVLNGNGSMAQFSHPEFGGSGQWMRGGMTMLGDMFNNYLKGRVDALCAELSDLLASQPGLLRSGGSFQSQSQGNGQDWQTQINGAPQGGSALFVPAQPWWPAELGQPDASGAQNQLRYAWFAAARRLAIDSSGEVWVYDTLDHQIGGFSQQQGGGNSISMSSQYGPVELNRLPVLLRNGQPVAPSSPAPAAWNPAPAPYTAPAPYSAPAAAPQADPAGIFAAIEGLGQLHAKGLLNEQEFNAKKAELLGRL
ncbi:MAG: hypothetical protein RJA44_2209 [Pseudomonadota bacterium]